MATRYENFPAAVVALGGSLGLTESIKEVLQCTQEAAWDLCTYKADSLRASAHDYLRLCDVYEVETANPDTALLRRLRNDFMVDVIKWAEERNQRHEGPTVEKLSLEMEFDLPEYAARHKQVHDMPIEFILAMNEAGLLRLIEEE